MLKGFIAHLFMDLQDNCPSLTLFKLNNTYKSCVWIRSHSDLYIKFLNLSLSFHLSVCFFQFTQFKTWLNSSHFHDVKESKSQWKYDCVWWPLQINTVYFANIMGDPWTLRHSVPTGLEKKFVRIKKGQKNRTLAEIIFWISIFLINGPEFTYCYLLFIDSQTGLLSAVYDL